MKKSLFKPKILNIEVFDNFEIIASNLSTTAVHEDYDEKVLLIVISERFIKFALIYIQIVYENAICQA